MQKLGDEFEGSSIVKTMQMLDQIAKLFLRHQLPPLQLIQKPFSTLFKHRDFLVLDAGYSESILFAEVLGEFGLDTGKAYGVDVLKLGDEEFLLLRQPMFAVVVLARDHYLLVSSVAGFLFMGF